MAEKKSSISIAWNSFWAGVKAVDAPYRPPPTWVRGRPSQDEKELARLHEQFRDWEPVTIEELFEYVDLPDLPSPLIKLLGRLIYNTIIFQKLPPLPEWSIEAHVAHKQHLLELGRYRHDPETYLQETAANLMNLAVAYYVDIPEDGLLSYPVHARLPVRDLIAALYEGRGWEVPEDKCTTPEYVERYAPEPFLEYFQSPVPIPHETFFSHTHVVGGSGAGKTQLLSTLYLELLKTDAAIVVVDSQGDFIKKLCDLKTERRVIHISPRYCPSINVFDVDTHGDEQRAAGAIEALTYLFSGILGADLTAKQGILFRYLCRFMLAFKEVNGRPGTIMDMLTVLDETPSHQDVVATLPPIQQQFFERDFYGKEFRQTREQVRYRLSGILENPVLARLLSQHESQLDLAQEFKNGSIFLIDTDQSHLKGQCGNFGRIFIAQVLQTILERATTDDRHPVFLLVDEAHQYFDQNIDDLLTQARKYRMGCVFAHQYMSQCTPALRSSLASNTAIKLASQVSSADAQALAGDMRTTRDFILAQPKLTFAMHVQGLTSAVSYKVTPGLLDHEEKGGEPIRYESDPIAGARASGQESTELYGENITEKHDPTQFG